VSVVSEYQYYEFVSVDQPLTAAQQKELRAVSTRARITGSSFVNEYQWGDLKADPQEWMDKYFDAFLYLSNWGTRRLALRLPLRVVDADVVAGYCGGESACSWPTRTHVVVDFHSEDEDDEAWWEGAGLLAPIVPVRAELAAGDRRLLYLAWLLCVQHREVADEELEPPIPPGLNNLSGPLQAVADFLRLDPDLLAVAAEASPPPTKAPSAAALGRWVKTLPEPDKDELLLRLLRDDVSIRAELLARFHGPSADHALAGTRTVGQLLDAAGTRWAHRQRLAREREDAERTRRELAALAARKQQLDALATGQEQAWGEIDTMIATKKPKDYDSAVTLLRDLKALAERDGAIAAFNIRLRDLRQLHIRKPGLLDRLDRARLD
jgi:hypothetical protein